MTAADAFSDILYNDRFIGAIEQIGWLTGLMDKVFVQIITVVAYLIISMPILKNALNGAYVAFPKAFDAVDEIKSGWGAADGGGVGFAKRVLAFFIPNIKSLTDFSDGTKSARAYFTTSLIQLIITVLIGVLIYNGVYRDLIGEGAEVGQHFFVNVILAQDYKQAMDNLIGAGKNYTFSRGKVEGSAGSRKDSINKSVYDRAKQAWPGTISTLTTDMLQTIGARVENHMERLYNSDAGGMALGEYFGNDSYSVTSGVDLHPSTEFISKDRYPTAGVWVPDGMGGGTFCFSATIAELGAGDGTNSSWVKDGVDHSKYSVYGQVIVVQRSTVVTASTGLNYNALMTVSPQGARETNGKAYFEWNCASLTAGEYGFESMTENGAPTFNGTIAGEQVTATVFYNKTNNMLHLVVPAKYGRDELQKQVYAIKWSRQSGSLNYGKTGEYRPIASISFTGGPAGSGLSAVRFSEPTGTFDDFSYGEVPKASSAAVSAAEGS